MLLLLFCQQQQQQQQQQPSSISHQFPQVFSSSRVSSRLVSPISSLKSSVLVGFQKSRSALFRCDSVACSSFRAFLFWCREVLLLLFCQQQQQQQQRQQPSSISLISSLRCSVLVYRVSEITLGTFSVRLCGLSFRALLFWCREVLLVLFCQQQQQQQQQQDMKCEVGEGQSEKIGSPTFPKARTPPPL